MALSVVISAGTLEGFLLISKLHYAQRLLSEEQSHIRFLVSFLRSTIHAAILPSEYPIVPILSQKDPQLSIRIRDDTITNTSMSLVRLYVTETVNKKSLTVFIQKDNNRREVLISDLRRFSIKFCSKQLLPSCVDAAQLHDWNSLEALEFTIQFKHHNILNHFVALDNHHVWQFRIKSGSQHEDQ